jgi:starch-binding outer membrane protein, SusD/RagB family
MKNAARVFISAALTGSFLLITPSCKNLTEQPDFASPASFYKTDQDMLAAVNGVYRPFNQQWFNTYYNRCVFDCALGTSTGYEKGPQYYKQGAYVASDEYIQAYWADNYDGINRASVVIDATPNSTASAELKKRINAEARFLRAMYYYQLYVFFENIPVTDKPTRELGNFVSNEGGKQKALDLMTADLKVAETDLPVAFTGDDMGRPNRWAAKTLLAKVLLEAGQWQPAADKAQEVITQSGRALFTNFNDLFDPALKNTGERLFEIQNNFSKSPWTNYNNMHAHFTPTDWDGGDPNTLAPGDGVTAAGWGDAWIVGDVAYRAMFQTGDRRIPVTFMEQYRSKNAGGDVVRFSPTANSPFVAPNSAERTYKNVIFQKVIEYNIGGWQNTKKNYLLLRVADAYLAHAEAVANGASGNGLASLNAIRQRAGIPAVGTLTRDAVLDEYLREFAGEGWNFAHARRFGRTAELIRRFAARLVDNAKFRVLPIPLVEINANANVKQNQGW